MLSSWSNGTEQKQSLRLPWQGRQRPFLSGRAKKSCQYKETLSSVFRHLSCICVDYEQCLFSLGPSSKTPETRKWPGCRPRFSRLAALAPLNGCTRVHSPYRFEIWRKRETARSLAFARHLIYSLNKYNIKVVTCYSIQYSQYVE